MAVPEALFEPASGFADELVALAVLLRQGSVDTESAECVVVRVSGDPEMRFLVLVDPSSGLVFFVFVYL